jgi:hypothetical protein
MKQSDKSEYFRMNRHRRRSRFSPATPLAMQIRTERLKKRRTHEVRSTPKRSKQNTARTQLRRTGWGGQPRQLQHLPYRPRCGKKNLNVENALISSIMKRWMSYF